jgi:ATP-dependent DNA ligase
MLAAAERLDLEGNVAKRKADAYRPETVWYKIKSRSRSSAPLSTTANIVASSAWR